MIAVVAITYISSSNAFGRANPLLVRGALLAHSPEKDGFRRLLAFVLLTLYRFFVDWRHTDAANLMKDAAF